MSESMRSYLDFAVETAYLAGRLTLGYYQTGLRPDFKADESPVTVADRRSEELIRAYRVLRCEASMYLALTASSPFLKGPLPKVMASSQGVRMPIAAAIGRFWVTARICRPKEVRCMIMSSTASPDAIASSRLSG